MAGSGLARFILRYLTAPHNNASILSSSLLSSASLTQLRKSAGSTTAVTYDIINNNISFFYNAIPTASLLVALYSIIIIKNS